MRLHERAFNAGCPLLHRVAFFYRLPGPPKQKTISLSPLPRAVAVSLPLRWTLLAHAVDAVLVLMRLLLLCAAAKFAGI